MKLLKIFIISLFSLQCVAQQPIENYDPLINDGTYFQDINGVYHPFEGIWLFQDQNIYFKIKLKTLENISFSDVYIDEFVGGYQLLINDQELVNTLANFDNNIPNQDNSDFLIGHTIIKTPNLYPVCHDCLPDELRLKSRVSDPNNPNVRSRVFMRTFQENGVEKMYFRIEYAGTHMEWAPGDPTTISLPYGEYVLIKQ